jgi:hypothetical protein
MKREYIKLFSFMLGASLILASVIFVVSNNIKEEKNKQIREEQEVIDEIGSNYKVFTEKAEAFATKHEELIKLIDEDTSYFSIIADNYGKMTEALKDYEASLKEIDDMDTYLHDHCDRKKFYTRDETNKECINYVRNLEKMTNIFVGDVKYFNHRIEEFNTWTEENNASVIAQRKYDKLEEYKSENYNEYVDLDNDGTKLGVSKD